jgi:hypothetical protein
VNTQATTSGARNNASINVPNNTAAETSSPTSTGKSPSAAQQRAAPRRPPVPQQQRDAFESALRRHGQDDEAATQAQGGQPWGEPLPLNANAQPQNQTQALTPATPREPAGPGGPAGAPPRTAAAQDTVSTHLRALGATAFSEQSTAQASVHSAAITPNQAIATHWQMQWAGATAPVQQVDLHRSETGALQLDMTGQAYASDPARLARLRDRVAARAQAGQVLVLAHPPGSSGSPGAPGQPMQQRRHPAEDEGDLA